MGRLRVFGGLLLLWAAQGVIGQVAVEAIKASVNPSPLRDAVLLAIWPLVIIVGGAVAVVWIWRQPTTQSDASAHRRAARPDPTPTAPPSSRPIPPPSPTPAREREYVPADVTVAYLVAQFADRTGIQAAKLVSVYLDKWMRVTGPLGTVGPGPDLVQVLSLIHISEPTRPY